MDEYKVKLHPNVDKFLSKLDPQFEIRIRNRLKLLRNDPFHYLEHYEGEKCYKFRTGDYRALIDVDQTRKIVFVQVLDHRKRIYKEK
ncbi:TPA: type II toxin-antitoxin system RelE/ParE family toxin [Candidatus Woesearchaeota archaeon]|nr:type II toxin-antitoxin system RelE/ParE family toxin [Candidatus Woesearchaeota archaeon]HIH39362.1 type II toxin-antitoxin system RelE/ParE family toxin [Candidatus Woesearchaeota archaeon]